MRFFASKTLPSSNTKGFRLTYLMFTDKEKFLGHSCIGISEVQPDGSTKLLFRVGLFPTNQVEIEDFIKNKPGRYFQERSWHITEEQIALVLHKINADRRDFEHKNHQRKRQPESKITLSNGERSIPGGPKYNLFLFNCKDYALSLVGAAGIETNELKNIGLNIPLFSGSLKDIKLIEEYNGVLNIIPIHKSKSFIEAMLDFIYEIINNLKNPIKIAPI